MEILVILSYILLGAALGVGADWLYWRQKFRQAGEQANARGEAFQRSYEEQLSAKVVQLAEYKTMLASREQSIKELEKDLARVKRQSSELEKQLQEEGRKLSTAEAAKARIPELETALRESEGLTTRLQNELVELQEEVVRLEGQLKEERKSRDSLVFVKGGHYLPGRVVRNLTRRNRPVEGA